MSGLAAARPQARFVLCGLATRTLDGEQESGDHHLVLPHANGVLLAAVDGLGHGQEAARAARNAVAILETHPQESAISLVQRCHEGLAGTRGVVMSLASFARADSTVTWLGVGNVEGVLVRGEPASQPSQEVLLLRGGVLGYQLPQLYASVIPVTPGDTIVFATDGIRRDFIVHVTTKLQPQALAERILKECAKGTDDALVLVARFAWEER